MTTAKVLNRGREQAVRLPGEFHFNCDEVCVARHGNVVILYPKGKGWDVMEKAIGQFTDDFMSAREKPGKPAARDWQ